MREPRPVLLLMLVQGLGVLVLQLWWLGLPAAERVERLTRVAVQEQAATLVPATVWLQPGWLLTHRLTRLPGFLGLVSLVLVISVSEGLARRQRDLFGGFLLRWWTTGVLALALSVSTVALFLVLPWPLPWGPVGLVCSGLVGLAGYGLASGRPYIS